MQRSRFVARQNIDLFVDRLELESDVKLRSTLWQLLVEEEDRYGELSEQLDLVDNSIRRAEVCITDQSARVARLEQDGVDASLARSTLNNFEHLHGLLLEHRRMVAGKLSRARL